MQSRPIITLTTDFGLKDEYVGVMKGVILTLLPETKIVDITHEVPAQDIRAAAFMFGRAYRYFPAGTVHLVVVDPGVGTDRRILAVHAGGQLFIAPDNGVLSPVLATCNKVMSIHSVTRRQLFFQPPGSTFHGRDIMAPVAARLAGGLDIATVGASVQLGDCVVLPPPRIEVGERRVVGEVIHADRFGNLCTSLTSTEIAPLSAQGQLRFRLGDTVIDGLCSSYSQGGDGRPLAIIDSHSHLEIAVNGGSAASLTGGRPGTIVTVEIGDV